MKTEKNEKNTDSTKKLGPSQTKTLIGIYFFFAKHSKVTAKTGWLGVKIMCVS
jgi:uncharacterized membrane protein